jgi:hypothetical protein
MLYLAAKDGEIIEQAGHSLPSQEETELLAEISLTQLWVDLLEFGLSTPEVEELVRSVSAGVKIRMDLILESGGAA